KGGEFEEFRDRASEIAERLVSVLTHIERDLLSTENSEAIAKFLRNVSALSESLRISLEDVSTPESRSSLKTMVENIAKAAAGIKSVTDAINEIRYDVYTDGKAMIIQIRQTAAVTANLANEVLQLTRHLDELVGENRRELTQVLTNLAETSRHLKETTDS